MELAIHHDRRDLHDDGLGCRDNIIGADNMTFAKATAWLRTHNAAPGFCNPILGIGVTCVVVVLPTLIGLYNF